MNQKEINKIEVIDPLTVKMIRINDIKDDELRELAYSETSKRHGEDYLEFAKQKNLELDMSFSFYNTDKEPEFWWGVASGNITKIS